MASFIRRFLVDPGTDVLLEIESVNILDLEPPSSITGIGTGTALMVGEFANGPFNTVTEVSSATDMVTNLGAMGYEQGGTKGNNPMARVRYADNAVLGEKWNGNGPVQLSGKKFKRLQLVRVDNSVGSVTFSLLSSVLGGSSFRYTLTTGQVLQLDVGGGATSATFTGTAAIVSGAAGTFNPASGATLTLGYDGIADFTVTFLSTDNTAALMRDRINLFAGFTFCDLNGGQLRLTSRQLGSGAQVRIGTGSGGMAGISGFTLSTNTAGGGNVVNIASVTPAEIKTIVEAGIANTLVEQLVSGQIRIAKATTGGTITVSAGTTAVNLGFTIGAVGTSTTPVKGRIPAGTIVSKAAAATTEKFVTMQDIDFTAYGVIIGGVTQTGATWPVKIRHATDDQTGIIVGAGLVTVISPSIDVAAFSCVNGVATTACMTEAQLDAAYVTAIAATLDPASVARQANVIWSARQSNAIRRTLKQNALDASANGLFGRMAIIRSPLGTTKALAMSTSAEPGVGAYRDQRVIYTWPGANTYVPTIAARGVGGGTGFTADGNVDVGADGWMASILSQLNPEENPGQLTSFTGMINDIDTLAKAQGQLVVGDYTLLKAAGIAALRLDDGTAIFQSGVTSVDPVVNPSLVRIARRRMADYIEDTIARRGKASGKKLNTFARRRAYAGEVRQFLRDLLSPNEPASQRISGYTVDEKSANTPEVLAAGRFRMLVNVRTLSSLDSIEIACTIGDSVEVSESLPLAA